MLGYVNIQGRGKIDDLLYARAEDLAGRGVRVAGAVQRNLPDEADISCDMDLKILTGTRTIRISQSLGVHASGCRLDPQALEEAVGEVEASLNAPKPPDLLIVNKFGRQEAEGRGFRTAISAALVRDIPTLIGVRDGYLADLENWAGGMAHAVSVDQINDWCKRATATD